MDHLKKQKISDIITTLLAILSTPKYFLKLLLFWAAILFILLWLFNLPLLLGIAANTPGQVPIILIEGYFNLFRFGLGLTPLLLLAISFFQAVSFSIKSYLTSLQPKKSLNISVMTISLVGAGCVSCGGSIIAPLLSVFGVTSATSINQKISNFILILALGLAIYSVVRVGNIATTLINLKGRTDVV